LHSETQQTAQKIEQRKLFFILHSIQPHQQKYFPSKEPTFGFADAKKDQDFVFALFANIQFFGIDYFAEAPMMISSLLPSKGQL
jgi:hypothetical protein